MTDIDPHKPLIPSGMLPTYRDTRDSLFFLANTEADKNRLETTFGLIDAFDRAFPQIASVPSD